MHDDTTAMPQSVRNYQKRLHRHRQLYWQVLLPVLLVLIGSFVAGYFLEGILVAALGVSIMMLVVLREIIDVLGYLGSLQRDAAVSRETLRQALADIKERFPPPQQ